MEENKWNKFEESYKNNVKVFVIHVWRSNGDFTH